MAEYEGIISSLRQNNRADVIIRPGSPGITGAPEISGKVCHCATDGSSLTIEVENTAGAGVGDRVLVRQETPEFLKNAGLLIGIPLCGLVAGVVGAQLVTRGFPGSVVPGLIAILAGLAAGLGIGVTLFRRSRSPDSLPVVVHVTRSRAEQAAMAAEPPCNRDNADACGGCSPSGF